MWQNPLPTMSLHQSQGSEDFKTFEEGHTGIPIGPEHPGSFGFKRANHTHEGIDLYCPEGTTVRAVEAGTVVAVINFTGPSATPPSPWWNNTQAILVEGETGVVVYGEIMTQLEVGDVLAAGSLIGHVVQVLTKDKGRPMSMLHLELHEHGTRDAYEWLDERPPSLLDPTSHLLGLCLDDLPL